MMDGFTFGFGGVFMMLFMAVFWVFVIAAAVWLVQALTRSQARTGEGTSTAHRILAERLARGEIDAEEFRTRRAEMEGAGR
jgi:putative membrane protein